MPRKGTNRTNVGRKSALTKQQGGKGKMVSAPVSMNQSAGSRLRRMTDRYPGSTRIMSIHGSSDFTVQRSIAIQPGLPESFNTWLATKSALYESFVVHKLTYRYKNFKGSQTDGNILLCYDPDVMDAPPDSAEAVSEYTEWRDGSPWRVFELTIRTSKKRFFTRKPGPYPVAGDPKTYDVGQLHICTEGMADDSLVGYLMVDYDVQFFDQQAVSVGQTLLGGSPSLLLSWEDTSIVPGQLGVLELDTYWSGLEHVNAGTIIAVPGGSLYRIDTSFSFSRNLASTGTSRVNINLESDQHLTTQDAGTIAFDRFTDIYEEMSYTHYLGTDSIETPVEFFLSVEVINSAANGATIYGRLQSSCIVTRVGDFQDAVFLQSKKKNPIRLLRGYDSKTSLAKVTSLTDSKYGSVLRKSTRKRSGRVPNTSTSSSSSPPPLDRVKTSLGPDGGPSRSDRNRLPSGPLPLRRSYASSLRDDRIVPDGNGSWSCSKDVSSK